MAGGVEMDRGVERGRGAGAGGEVPLEQRADRDLIAQHCAGDSEAFGELFRRHRDRMWAVALRTTGNREVASDCLQEAFLAAFRRAESYRGDAAVTTWLHRIVVNACLDRLRRERPVVPLADREVVDRHDAPAQVETRLDVHEALARLPEAQRVALVLVDMHGLPVAEAAAVLEVPEGTVKSRCARGRAALATLLGPSVTGVAEPSGAP